MRRWQLRFTIRRLMAVVAIAAIFFWALPNPGYIFIGLGLGGLVVAFVLWAWKPKRAPSTEFLCALIGMIMGFLLLPVEQIRYPADGFIDLIGLLRIIGGAVAGASVGAIIGWADRRIISMRRGLGVAACRWVVVLTVAGLALGRLAWSLPSEARHIHDVFVQIGPYILWSGSPAFWAILGLMSAAVVGLMVGVIAVIVFIGRRIKERCHGGPPISEVKTDPLRGDPPVGV
jgi:hypothetical protein